MNWFTRLTGFEEQSYHATRQQLHCADGVLTSKANGASWPVGRLSTPSLAELREQSQSLKAQLPGPLVVRNIVEDAYELHARADAHQSVIQVASQFNLLEMVGPDVSPEHGVGGYEYDLTQGPACARAAGVGTIYRNYFAPVGEQSGQTADRQIDTLADLRLALPGAEGIRMVNGYALIDEPALSTMAQHLARADEDQLNHLRGLLRIGVHEDVLVTVPHAADGQTVTQAYCSAMPVSYNHRTARQPHLWRALASLVLDAAYEATLHAALINAVRTGNPHVYLTFLGGGAFGNDRGWILSAIRRALGHMQGVGLRVHLVSYRYPAEDVADMLSQA